MLNGGDGRRAWSPLPGFDQLLVTVVMAASGTSIGGAFYVTLIGMKVSGVKWRGPVTRFGLKLDVQSLELT